MPVDSTFPRTRSSTARPDLISVIVCTYNRAEMIEGAITSLKDQRTSGRFDFEILVVDDGSTDSTNQIVIAQQNVSKIPIRYIRQEHAGVAAARNRGVGEALGNYIAFFDDDQIAEKDWLSELAERALTDDADCVGGPCLLRLPLDCKSQLDPTIRRLLGEDPGMMPETNLIGSGFVLRNREATPGTGNVLIKRSLFEQIGLFSEGRVYGEDREFFMRAQRAGARFAISPHAVVYHIVPPSRLTATYLFRTATLGGQTQAETDGYKDALRNASLRLAYLLVIAIPKLGYAILRGNQASILGRKCSIRFSLEYILVALRRGKRMCITISGYPGNPSSDALTHASRRTSVGGKNQTSLSQPICKKKI